MVNAVYAVEWTEYERGWGSRPDGLTLHKDLETAQEYIRSYWKRMPDQAPDEYSRPSDPKLMAVDEDVMHRVQELGSTWANPRGYTVDRNYLFRD